MNLKNLKQICNKLHISTNDFQYYSEVILQTLFLIKDEDKITEEQYKNYMNIIETLRNYEIDKKDFDKFIKLNKHNKYWLKKINTKIKKRIFKDLFN